MATKVLMAQLSPTMEEGRLIEWKAAEGDEIAQGDVVVEIETDKANMEVEAMGAGLLRKILVQEGETVPVGTLIGVIAAADEDIESLIAAEAPVTAAAESPSSPAPSPPTPGQEALAAPPAGPAEAPPTPETAPPVTDGRVKASPVARKIARERGLDLTRIAGSGPGGRIVKADVEGALASGLAPAPAGVPAAAPPLAPAPPPTFAAMPDAPRLREHVAEASQMRKAIARRLVESLGPVPHFYLTTEVDMGRGLDLRADLNERWTDGKIGVNDLLLKAAAEALVRHPEVNASWEGDSVRFHGRVDLGIAVAVEGGLITPVLRSAEQKGLRQISFEAGDLIARARDRKLLPEEYQGSTFSISNLGMFEIDEFTAVINPPEAAILAIGKTSEKPVVLDGQVEVRQRMRVTMSCDHRVVDGATGARFLATFKAMLENPLEMVL
jgi:pyruvate dehydrogenase E2 component (dihydrolipoamide acetyltransferase)